MSIQGFLLQRLNMTGWKLNGETFFRQDDALFEAQRTIADRECRGVRILRAAIDPDAVFEQLVARDDVDADQEGGAA